MPADPPIIHLGEVLLSTPMLVAPGTAFTLFKLDADNKLQVDETSSYTNQPAFSTWRDNYISQLLSNNIVVVNTGPETENTFAQPSFPLKLIIKRKKYDLYIVANDQNRDCEDAPFDFTGTEFTSSGLQDGDIITHVDFASTGATTDSAGVFPIVPSNATIVPSVSDKYDITYSNGSFTVSCCPWGNADTFPVKYVLNYAEQTNQFNGVSATTKVVNHNWDRHSTLETDEVTNGIGDPHGFGSSGVARCHVKLERTNAHTVKVTVTITDTGKHWENLTGDPATKIINLNCESFAAGLASADFAWTAQYFGGAPIGLVMSFHINIMRGP